MGEILSKTLSKIPSNVSVFCSSATLFQLLNKFVVNVEDKHLVRQKIPLSIKLHEMPLNVVDMNFLWFRKS